jgi:hypothetical protein
MPLRGLAALAVAASMLFPATALAQDASRHDHNAVTVPWADLQGRPAYEPGQTPGIFVWNTNDDGVNMLHLHVTTAGETKVYTGRIVTGEDGYFSPIDRDHFEHQGDFVHRLNRHEIVFRLTNSGHDDGFDVRWSGRRLRFAFETDGRPVPSDVHFGASALSPSGLPVAVDAGAEGLLTLPWSVLDGQTSFDPGNGHGYYLFRDTDGVHLRTTNREQTHRYTGALWTDGGFDDVHGYQLEDGDRFRRPSPGRLGFAFVTHEGADGLDVRVAGSEMVLSLSMDGDAIDPAAIQVGARDRLPVPVFRIAG